MKAAALRGALSDRSRHGRVHVLSSLVEGDSPSTKAAVAVLSVLGDRRNLLVVLERGDEVGWKSLRNLDRVHVLPVDQLNTYDVLVSDDVVFTTGSLEAFLAGAPKGRTATAVATESEAAMLDVPLEIADEPAADEPAAEKPAKKAAKKAAAKEPTAKADEAEAKPAKKAAAKKAAKKAAADDEQEDAK
jgi:large subunit ribosomal protein L4